MYSLAGAIGLSLLSFQDTVSAAPPRPVTTVTGYDEAFTAPWPTDRPFKDNPWEVPANANGLDVEKPNMILFMPDQLRYDAVGAFGNNVSPLIFHFRVIKAD